MPSSYAMSSSLPVPYKEEEMMDTDATLSSSMSSLEELPLSDDALRALMNEADHSLQLAQELQRAALWHVYHSDASAAPRTTATTSSSDERKGSMVSTTSTTADTLDTDLLLSTTTTLGEGTLFRLATALSYYKESTVHMERYQSLQARIASQDGGSASGTGSNQGNVVHRWNIVPETTH
jgi:hypothetical protein